MLALCVSTYLYSEADSSQIIRFDNNFTCNFQNGTSKLIERGQWDSYSLNSPFTDLSSAWVMVNILEMPPGKL